MKSPPGPDTKDPPARKSVGLESPAATQFAVPELDTAEAREWASAKAAPDVVATQFAVPDLVLTPTDEPKQPKPLDTALAVDPIPAAQIAPARHAAMPGSPPKVPAAEALGVPERKAPPAARTAWGVAAVIAGVGLAGGGIALWLSANTGPGVAPESSVASAPSAPDPTPAPPLAPSRAPPEALTRPSGPAADPSSTLHAIQSPAPGSCPAGMAGIPGGELPVNGRSVALAGYCLDLTEVTVDAYAKCVEAKACTEPKPHGARRGEWEQFCNWRSPGRGDHPVSGIDWSQAQAYCTFERKRLPTDEEWEWAARNGSDGASYPWGDQAPTSQLLNACGGECPVHGEAKGFPGWKAMYSEDDGWAETSPVGSYPKGANRWGVLDLAGNVWEWTSGSDAASRVQRGGSWFTYFPAIVRASYRFAELPSVRSCLVGARCAKSP